MPGWVFVLWPFPPARAKDQVDAVAIRSAHAMEFDQYTLLLLLRREDAPALGEAALNELQDAHLAHLARLHEQGDLLAAGPALGPDDRRVRGVCLFGVPLDRALALEAEDPAVRAGRFRLEAFPWVVPRGTVSFPSSRFPQSQTEADR